MPVGQTGHLVAGGPECNRRAGRQRRVIPAKAGTHELGLRRLAMAVPSVPNPSALMGPGLRRGDYPLWTAPAGTAH
jgi:hypothetical protein